MSAPCTTQAFDRPFPGATDVVSRVVDVPSVRFPGFWQEGTIGAYPYKIFSNGEGQLQSARRHPDWVIGLVCDEVCEITTQGTPPENAVKIAAVIGECLLGTDITEEDVATAQSLVSVAQAAQPTAPTPVAVPINPEVSVCTPPVVSEASQAAKFQRLLVIAGQDPGPVDGFLGPLTFQAFESIIDETATAISTADAIKLVEDFICENATN
jgi:hypothetical protein